MQKIILTIGIGLVLFLAACQNNVNTSAGSSNTASQVGNAATASNSGSAGNETKAATNLASQVTAIPSNATTPTEAYKALYKSVNTKNGAATKGLMSEASLQLIEMQSQRSNKPYDEVLQNGLIQANLAPTMPEVRDQRVKDTFGAVEVFDVQAKSWQDVPFIYEGGSWKLGVGDQFKGTYQSPGLSKSQRDNPNPTLVPAKGMPSNMKPPKFNQANPTLNSNVPVTKPIERQN